jgi:glucose/arabinose dehydrogenase
MNRRNLLGLLIFFFWNAVSAQQYTLTNYFEGLEKFSLPLDAIQAPGDKQSWYIAEQRGKIYKVSKGSKGWEKSLFLNLGSSVSQRGYETGLLGVAFHPEYPAKPMLYVSFTQGQGSDMISKIQQLKVTNDKPDLNSATTLISTAQPYENHNGGCIVFGPDGYLYISFGDGGSAGDPKNNAQNTQSYLGKILRIDVNTAENGKNYSIPKDNPFVQQEGFLPEIYAYGLRNVWRMTFDDETGKLWAGDVGQNAYEEIDIIEKGGNYGWRLKEGFECFNPKAGCERSNLKNPVYAYSQINGDRSITGGLVYRGKTLSKLTGQYIYADFITGRVWALSAEKVGSPDNRLLVDETSPRNQISHFVQSPQQELLVLSHSGGMLMKLVPVGNP